jgi:phosphoribosylformylglycinamidine synthase I
MRWAVVTFPGSNCDQDCVDQLGRVLRQQVVEVWHKDFVLPDVDCVVLPGGFSYGDYLRAGSIARFANIMGAVSEFAAKGGLVLGICNGFQILLEAGLLPGAMQRNENLSFICKNVPLRVEHRKSPLTALVPEGQTVLNIPIAHMEGNYTADEDTLNHLEENGQILFRYSDEGGAVNQGTNPNGSRRNIAGICNDGRNIFGMMPHPERASESILGSEDGAWLFRSLIAHVEGSA